MAAGERFSAAQYAGGAVVLLAVLVVIAAERPRRRRPVLGLQRPEQEVTNRAPVRAAGRAGYVG